MQIVVRHQHGGLAGFHRHAFAESGGRAVDEFRRVGEARGREVGAAAVGHAHAPAEFPAQAHDRHGVVPGPADEHRAGWPDDIHEDFHMRVLTR